MPSCKAKAQLDQHPKHGQLVSLNVTLYPENSPSMGSAWSRVWPLEGDDKRTLFNELVEFASRHNVDYALVKAEVERALAEAKPYVREETFAMPAGVGEEEVNDRPKGQVQKLLEAQAPAMGQKMKAAVEESIAGEKPKEGVTLDDLDEMRGKTSA